MQKSDNIRVILSGGGTGGHIFPAVAIANAIRETAPNSDILFVGAKGRMEMEKVPAAGYPIIGLWINGLQRRLTADNLMFPFKVISSLYNARKIIKSFKPDVVVGTGGFASGPTLRMASWLGIPTLIQEQNSFPGITNKMLASKADIICVAYQHMDKFFPASKIRLTGNPVRHDIEFNTNTRKEALKHFGLSESKTTLLVVGGSLGARTINHSIHDGLSELASSNIQLIWQTGIHFVIPAAKAAAEFKSKGIITMAFIKEMDKAYAAADIVVSRAGAIAISELCITGKPSILVPSPNVAEDHQTKNALSLSLQNAAILVKDTEAPTSLIHTIKALALNIEEQKILSNNISSMANRNSAKQIAEYVFELALSIKK
ncbi:MAG: undecaprenyldiphospho-muramoylpentapeptide beta-N-acetylglucosaminyltransferase [Lentimicrobiaceae bacterium]|jgi:UDP-N-acetylglucosamine--N-acetylmuramyl-(pentapeptide) pyrophosphoryl-undecaprenol N-acetylglucosamine transferase